MTSISDLHAHSLCSGDARSTLREMCARAAQLGIERIAFTEHLDLEPTDPQYGHYDYGWHRREIEGARREFGDRLEVLMGIEIDYQPDYHDGVAQFLTEHDFDLVLGAVHYVDHAYLDSDEFLSQPQREAYGRYFRAVTEATQTGLFGVMAHLDYCKRHGHEVYGGYDPADFEEGIREALQALIQTGTVLEVNTSGLRQDPRETYPSPVIVRWYREMGGQRIALGSDGHDTDQLGYGLEEGLAIAREAGFTRWEGGWLVAPPS